MSPSVFLAEYRHWVLAVAVVAIVFSAWRKGRSVSAEDVFKFGASLVGVATAITMCAWVLKKKYSELDGMAYVLVLGALVNLIYAFEKVKEALKPIVEPKPASPTAPTAPPLATEPSATLSKIGSEDQLPPTDGGT
jgi:hypothetical protein